MVNPHYSNGADDNTVAASNEFIDDIPSGWFYSFEFFPPKTEAGLDNLLTRIDRMTRRLDPLFVDVTWGSGGTTSARSLAVASHAQRFCGVDVLFHLTTNAMTRPQLESTLQQAKSCGICNILALRGDPPRGRRSWAPGDISGGYCDRAIDLVKLIRELHGDFFGIAVAGHPEGHPASHSWDEEMRHLKEKIDAGADFVITQFFYDTDAFIAYVKRCREHDITCPIMPGIMPIQSFSTFVKMTTYCGVAVPQSILERLAPVKDDDEAVKLIGCEIASDMCHTLLTAGLGVDGVHFYTLNLERSVSRILMSLGAIDVVRPGSSDETTESKDLSDMKSLRVSGASTPVSETVLPNSARQFPWRPSAMAQRSKEEVR
jgi:methylenetetrahydrofolate reductase (NADPH)